MDLDNNSLLYSMGVPDGYAGLGLEGYPHMPGQAPLNVDANQIDWAAMDWDLVNAPAAEAAESANPSRSRQTHGPSATQG